MDEHNNSLKYFFPIIIEMKQTIESNVLNFFVKKQKLENKIKTTQINQISSTFV